MTFSKTSTKMITEMMELLKIVSMSLGVCFHTSSGRR